VSVNALVTAPEPPQLPQFACARVTPSVPTGQHREIRRDLSFHCSVPRPFAQAKTRFVSVCLPPAFLAIATRGRMDNSPDVTESRPIKNSPKNGSRDLPQTAKYGINTGSAEVFYLCVWRRVVPPLYAAAALCSYAQSQGLVASEQCSCFASVNIGQT